MEAGSKAPEFSLQGLDKDGNEETFSLSGLLRQGKDIILYFYPRDNTPGCTLEACDFRDNYNRLTARALVVGVSPDSLARHEKFRSKFDLNYILLSDPDKKVMAAYGAFGEKKIYGKSVLGVIRSTFIISPEGRIKKAWHKVKAKGHVDQVLQFLDT